MGSFSVLLGGGGFVSFTVPSVFDVSNYIVLLMVAL